MSPSQQHDKTLLQLNFFIIFSSLSFLGIALWLIAQQAIFLFLNKFHFRHSSIIPGLMSLDAICINGWLGFLHSFSCSLSRRFPLITKRIIWEENHAKQKRRREGKTLCFWYRVNIRRLLRCSLVLLFEWPGESCNAICVLLLLQKAPQLHPSNMKLMTISQHEHEIFMFSFTLFSSPLLASFFFAKSTASSFSSSDILCAPEHLMRKNNGEEAISGKCRSIGRNCKLRLLRGKRELEAISVNLGSVIAKLRPVLCNQLLAKLNGQFFIIA